MNIHLNNEIVVGITTTPKKKKTSPALYDIYLKCTISQRGVQSLSPVTFPLGIVVPVAEWGGRIGMKGRSDRARAINDMIATYKRQVSLELEKLKPTDTKTCGEVREVVETKVRTAVTGKAPRGQKQAYRNQIKDYSVQAILEDYLTTKQQSQGRKRIYHHAINILHRYYKYNTPLITNINTGDLEKFQVWYRDHYRKKWAQYQSKILQSHGCV